MSKNEYIFTRFPRVSLSSYTFANFQPNRPTDLRQQDYINMLLIMFALPDIGTYNRQLFKTT